MTSVSVSLPEGYCRLFDTPPPQPFTFPQPDTYYPQGKLGQMLTHYPTEKLLAGLDMLSQLAPGEAVPGGLNVSLLNLTLKLYTRTPVYMNYFYGYGINLMRHLAAQAPLFHLAKVPIFLIEVPAEEVAYFLEHTPYHSSLPEIIGFNLVHFHSLQMGTRLGAAIRLERAAPGMQFPLLAQCVRLLAPEPAFPLDCNWPLAAILGPQWRLVAQPAYLGHHGITTVILSEAETQTAIEEMQKPFPYLHWPIPGR